MKIEKRFTLAATPAAAWAFITDPNAIAPCIPGCHDVTVLTPGTYRAGIKVQVGPIKTTFAVIVETRIERPPEFAEYTTQGEEGGKASRLSAVSALTVTPCGDGECEVTYTSDINLSGRLGKFGAGVMQKIADNLGDRFVAALREKIVAV